MGTADPAARRSAQELVETFLDAPMRDQARSTRATLAQGQSLSQTLEVASDVHARTDQTIAALLAITPLPQQPACRRGCSACCFLQASASIPEVIQIGERIRQHWPEESIAALRQRIDDHIAASQGLSLASRLALRLRCPLLDDNGDCSIYDVRPNSCRGWNSLDARLCDYDLAHPHERVQARSNEWQWAVAGRIGEGAAIACHAANADHRVLDLVRGVKIALDDPDVSDAWRSGRDAFADAVQSTVFPARDDPQSAAQRKALWNSVTDSPAWNEP